MTHTERESRGITWTCVERGRYVAELNGESWEMEKRGREVDSTPGWYLFGPEGAPFGWYLGDGVERAVEQASRYVLHGPSGGADRDTLARALSALSCMRRSGETAAALRRRDAEIARLESVLAAFDEHPE